MAPVVFEIVLGIGLVILVFTQILIPMYYDLPLFPSFKFHKSAVKLEDAVAEEIEAQEQIKIEDTIRRAQRAREDARYGFKGDK